MFDNSDFCYVTALSTENCHRVSDHGHSHRQRGILCIQPQNLATNGMSKWISLRLSQYLRQQNDIFSIISDHW